MSDMPEPPADQGLPPDLRFLKWLVTGLTATMVLGLITLIVLLVIRLPGTQAIPVLPEGVSLPQGATAEAVTFGQGWIAVVTGGNQILIYDAASGTLRQTANIAP